MPSDQHYMHLAIRLAQRGLGYVEPNPPVGCVIVKNNRIIAHGYHKRFGGPHAEVHALKAAGPRARGATMYVTLEPCKHFGKTPPCTRAILNARIKRVVIGAPDPYKLAAGGAAILRRAGLKVTLGVCPDDANQLIAPYIKRITTGLPWVIAKWASTLDGHLTIPTPRRPAKRPPWISNPKSRRIVHLLRGRVDAIMVGIGTVLTDNPTLTARGVPIRRKARRVVIDPSFRTPLTSKLFKTLSRAPLTLFVAPNTLKFASPALKRAIKMGVEVIPLKGRPDRHGRWKLAPILRHLARRHNVTNLLVEGGPTLLAALFDQKLVDRATVFISPKLIFTGKISPHRIPDSNVKMGKILRSQHLRLERFHRIGNDLQLEYLVQ